MILEFEDNVCKNCGSNRVSQHHQVQVLDFNIKEGRRWTTKKEREENPDLIISQVQSLLWKSDPTWYSCDKCGERIDSAEIEKAWEVVFSKHPELKDSNNWNYREELGEVIINDYAIRTIDIK